MLHRFALIFQNLRIAFHVIHALDDVAQAKQERHSLVALQAIGLEHSAQELGAAVEYLQVGAMRHERAWVYRTIQELQWLLVVDDGDREEMACQSPLQGIIDKEVLLAAVKWLGA